MMLLDAVGNVGVVFNVALVPATGVVVVAFVVCCFISLFVFLFVGLFVWLCVYLFLCFFCS